MKTTLCYMQTLIELDTFIAALFNFGAIYIAHDFIEQKSYRKGKKIYEPLKCRRCGYISTAYREF